MDVKNYLKKVEQLESNLRASEELLHHIKTSATSISISYGERVQSSGSQDKLGDTVTKVVDLEQEVLNKRIELIKFKMKVISQFNKLENGNYISLLVSRYLENKTLVEIAKEQGCSYGTIKTRHGEALSEFARVNGFSNKGED